MSTTPDSAALRLGPGNPVAHHVTNVVISSEPDGTADEKRLGLPAMSNRS
ncbi:hypothetical protein [Virgisporangium aliadipatigenens]|nr:hypothetical protein [Virgisporangium aliadipatigenens]